jgi:hypothetical protein
MKVHYFTAAHLPHNQNSSIYNICLTKQSFVNANLIPTLTFLIVIAKVVVLALNFYLIIGNNS